MPVFLDGYELCVPTSTAVTGAGSSATINAKGSVTFTSCASLSLNGVFSSTYDNYLIVMRHVLSTSTVDLYLRLRDSTPADASGTNYTRQYIYAAASSVSAARTSSATMAGVGYTSATQRNGTIIYLYGPNLAQPTAIRNVDASSENSASILDFANTHSLSTAYVGATIFPQTGSISGLLCVYGAVQ